MDLLLVNENPQNTDTLTLISKTIEYNQEGI